MAIEQPQSTDKLNNPSHSLLHRQIASDASTSAGAISVASDDVITVKNVIRGATGLWYRAVHVCASSVSQGASGATFTAPSTDTLGGYNIDTNTEYLYFGNSITSQWDGASDLSVRITWEVNVNNTGGADTDTVDLRLNCYYKGHDDVACKSQVVEESTIVGKSVQYKRFTTLFTIDWDASDNIVEVGDKMNFRLNLETDTSEVDNIIVNTIMFRYQTDKINPEV